MKKKEVKDHYLTFKECGSSYALIGHEKVLKAGKTLAPSSLEPALKIQRFSRDHNTNTNTAHPLSQFFLNIAANQRLNRHHQMQAATLQMIHYHQEQNRHMI